MCVTASTLTHARLKVRRRDDATKTRSHNQLDGVSPTLHYTVFNDSLINLVRGILERVFFVKDKVTGQHRAPYTPLPDVFASRLKNEYNHFNNHRVASTTLSREQFLNCYSGRKREVYGKAVESLLHSPITSCDAEITCFIKATEKTNLTAKPDPVPRIISPRGPRYGTELGRYIKPLEPVIVKRVAKLFGTPTITKSMNATQVGKLFKSNWDYFDHPVAVGLDASRFDQHVSQQALAWEHSIYMTYHPKSTKLKWLLEQQLTNTVRGYTRDGSVKYTVDGGRMSGDMNTGLGNCLIMCSLIHAYCKERTVEVKLVNNGDDCVVIMENKDLAKFSYGLREWFEEMGFDMKVENPVYTLEEIEFCQTQPVFDGTDYVMCRNPTIAMAKDSICTRSMQSRKEYEEWVASVAEGGLSLTGGLPVLQCFYSSLKRASNGAVAHWTDRDKDSGFYNMSRGMSKKYRDPTPESRVSFYRAFKLTPDAQLALEGYYDTYTPVYSPRVYERRDFYAEVDCASLCV